MQIYKTKRCEGFGFTLVELLVVIGIIGLLAAILVPVTSSVRGQARVVVTKSNINTLNNGVEKFCNDMGSYPSSSVNNPAIAFTGLNQSGVPVDPVDIGAHRLVEALVGIDLLGYSTSGYYEYDSVTGEPTEKSPRQGLYVDIEGENLTVMDPRNKPKFTFADLNIGAPEITNNLNPMFIDASGKPRPILYYKADKREALIGRIYNAYDNVYIADDDPLHIGGEKYPCLISAPDPYDRSLYNAGNFQGYIWDPASSIATNPGDDPRQEITARPYNKDTFLLIAAGPDGIYGSEDDICNFDRK